MRKRIWLIPAVFFLISIIMGILAKFVWGLPRGALLWDASLITLSASIFGTLGYIIGLIAKQPESEETY